MSDSIIGYRDLAAYIQSRSSHIRRQGRVSPAEAITNASSLIETVCKYILESLGEKPPSGIEALALATHRRLKDVVEDGTPSQVVESLNESICRLISALGHLRDSTGSAHGASARQPRSPNRDTARLAVVLAEAICAHLCTLWKTTFIEKTYEQLTEDDRSTLVQIVDDELTGRRLKSIDHLPYSRVMDVVRKRLYQARGVRPKLPELWRAILNLRKEGRFTRVRRHIKVKRLPLFESDGGDR